MEKLASKKFCEKMFYNRKLRKRLQDLVYANGLTEEELCERLGISMSTWISVAKGLRRPSHDFINILMGILGDEIQLLFLSVYIEEKYPNLITADKYETNSDYQKIEKLKQIMINEGKKFGYLHDVPQKPKLNFQKTLF